MSAPIEVTTRYATSVDSLQEAWSFVMDHVDLVGPDPMIKIDPFWSISMDQMGEDVDPPRKFGVVVEGMISNAP